MAKPLPSLDYVPPTPPRPDSYVYNTMASHADPLLASSAGGLALPAKGSASVKAPPVSEGVPRAKGSRAGKGSGYNGVNEVWRWPLSPVPEAPLPQALFMDRGQPVLFDVPRRSYAFYWPKAFPLDASNLAFEKLMEQTPWDELTNRRGVVTRKSCFVTGINGVDCTCGYVYGDTKMPSKRVPFLERLTEVLFGNLFPDLPAEQRPSCANVNLYEHGEQSCGWHADDEKLFGDGSSDVTIVSLSLGSTREFWLALRKSPKDVNPRENSVIELDLGHGDLMTMEGLCQKHTVHMVPRADARGSGPRINVTWRWIRQHQASCPLVAQNEMGVTRGIARFLEPLDFTPNWCRGREVKWGVCAYCEHPGYKGGRALIETPGMGWLCRLCILEWAERQWQQHMAHAAPALSGSAAGVDWGAWPPGWSPHSAHPAEA